MTSDNLCTVLDELIALQHEGGFVLFSFHLCSDDIKALVGHLGPPEPGAEEAGSYKGVPVYLTGHMPVELERRGVRIEKHRGVRYTKLNFVVLD